MRNLPENTNPRRKREVLTVEQYHALLADEELPLICKIVLQLCTMTGLRSCEAIGLRWEDVDFRGCKIFVRRSVKGHFCDAPKTVESEATVPMHEDLAGSCRAGKRLPRR